MTANITTIIGRPHTPKGYTIRGTVNGDYWLSTYISQRKFFERKRQLENRSAAADWFLIMSDGSEVPLPTFDEIGEMEEELKTVTREFWAKKLNLST